MHRAALAEAPLIAPKVRSPRLIETMLSTIGRYLDPWEAHVLRARLEAEGIPATVACDQHIMAGWPMAFALGGALLQVPSAFAAQAQGVIEAYHAGALLADLVAEHPEAADRCPACGAEAILQSVPVGQRVLNSVAFLVATSPFPARASRLECRRCGHRWTYRS